MRTIDRTDVAAPLSRVFALAADVEQWPTFLEHYRWVRFLERSPAGGVVEMAAWRRFGSVPYPTWWVSEMHIDAETRTVRYRHIRGITRGMDVAWTIRGRDGAVDLQIVHDWAGPRWPLVGGAAARLVIGPVFIHAIAARTLAGVKRRAETSCVQS
ncbi:MAG TPA: SRPBCC family protein [Gemmatimonadales bacterium]